MTAHHDHTIEIGSWPAYVRVEPHRVSIESDHNTDDYDTDLYFDQVRALYHALGAWMIRNPKHDV